MDRVSELTQTLPWAPWVFCLFVAAGVLTARYVARHTRCPIWCAVLLVAGFGLVAAMTLTPLNVAASVNADPTIATSVVRPPWMWWSPSDRFLNILLFVPLGIAVGLLGSRTARLWLSVAALCLPWIVEGVQYVVAPLHRDPQWQDVFDNTVGVLLGFGIAWGIGAWRRSRARRRETLSA